MVNKLIDWFLNDKIRTAQNLDVEGYNVIKWYKPFHEITASYLLEISCVWERTAYVQNVPRKNQSEDFKSNSMENKKTKVWQIENPVIFFSLNGEQNQESLQFKYRTPLHVC